MVYKISKGESSNAYLADDYEVFIEASVCGYHAYFKDLTIAIGKVLMCKRDV